MRSLGECKRPVCSSIVHRLQVARSNVCGIDSPYFGLARQSVLVAVQRHLDGHSHKSEYNFTMADIRRYTYTLVWVSGHDVIDRIIVVLGGTDFVVRFTCAPIAVQRYAKHRRCGEGKDKGREQRQFHLAAGCQVLAPCVGLKAGEMLQTM